jgi:hypothetical protein
MTITKKKLVVLISVFLIMFVFSSLVIAQSFNDNSDRPFVDNTDYTKLDACVINCKEVVCANEGEECRSKCIRGCKADFDVGDDFGKGDELFCLPCGDGCGSVDFVSSAMCLPPTKGEPVCGVDDGKCVVVGFEDENPIVPEEVKIEDDDFFDDIEEDLTEDELDKIKNVGTGGIGPDSPFYFIDEMLANLFGESREEKIAEIKTMIEKGKYDAAEVALKKYQERVEKFMKNARPEDRDMARREAAGIRRILRGVEERMAPEEREVFVEDFADVIIGSERNIVTAVEISSKIKELCQSLSELDPEKYKEICRSDDESPKWQKELDQELTKEQKEEAKKFGRIMGQCFKTSGRDCACDDISFYDFSVACSKAAPLAAACDSGDEGACDELGSLDMPRLPDYLQDVFDELEGDVSEAKYDMHMPRECVEAGATSPKECGRIMIKEHAPLECREALLEANTNSESEGREICDRIMMEKHAPKCVEKGISDPEECANFMDNLREDDFEGQMVDGSMGRGPRDMGPPGRDCMSLENSDERLKCFENAVGDTGNRYGIGDKFKDGEGEITWQCKEHMIHWGPDCETFMREEWPKLGEQKQEELDKERREREEYDFLPEDCKKIGAVSKEACDKHMRDVEEMGPGCDDCSSQCPGASRTDCINNRCECFYEDKDPERRDGEPQYGDNDFVESECNNGCQDECPGASRTDCVDGGMRCKCFYEDESGSGSDGGGYQGGIDEPYIEPGQTVTSGGTGSIDSGETIIVDSDTIVDGTTASVDSSVDEVSTDSGSNDEGTTDSGGSSDSGSSTDSSSGGGGGNSVEPTVEPVEPIEAITGEAFLDYWDK